MIKYILTMFSAIFGSIQAYAQVPNEPIAINVIYQFIHVDNLSERGNPRKTEMVLSVGKTTSRYMNADVYYRLNTPKPTATPGARGVAGFPIAVMNSGGAVISEIFFQMPFLPRLISAMALGSKDYIAEDKLIPINWVLAKDTRKIGGFECQKATGTFAGRIYTAWFSPDLPFQNGPFKLWGLPGLILEAQDSKGEVKFLFKDINRETDTSKSVSAIGSKPVKISQSEYAKAKKAYQNNPDTYMQGQLPANAPKVVKIYENGANEGTSKVPILNPIEL